MEKVLKNRNEIDLTSGNLFKKIIIVALPLMFSGILQLLYNAADLIVCGIFGSVHAVGAISATISLINLIIQLFIGFSIGASVVMAKSYGAEDKEKCKRIVHTALTLSLIIGVIVGIFGFFFSENLLHLMNTKEEIIDLSSLYLKIYFIGLPFSMIYNFGSALLRATGNTKRPFYFLALSGIVNVIVNLILVVFFSLDVAGVAIGTIVAQFLSSVMIVIYLLKTSGYCKLNIKELKIHKEELIEIIRVGLPAGIQGSIFSLSNVIIQSSVNSLPIEVVDGNGASNSLEGFIFTSMNAIAQTCVSFVSANLGAKKEKNINKSVIYSTILVVSIGLILGGLMILFGKPLLSLYVNEAAVEEGYKRLLILCSLYFLCGLMDTYAYCLRGIGYSFLPTIITLIGACGIRILWVLTVFNIDYFHNIEGLAYSYPLSWGVTFIIHLILFLILKKKVYKKLNSN